MKTINPADYPVMFDAELASAVTERTLFKAHQLCHGTNNTTRCKGSFDYNFAIYERMGLSHLVAM